ARREISRLPSASLLAYLTPGQGVDIAGKILAVGNPDGTLAWAETEASYVASLFGAKALLGGSASEVKVREALPGCSLVHFATHGKLDRESPFNSALMLADGEELTVYELAGIRLDAQLVVLSACETGKGRTTGGDDLLGLTRALLGAGVRSAVVSLWPVDDLSTSLLMGEFYRRLLSGLSPAAALCLAREYLRNLPSSDLPGEIERLKRATAPGKKPASLPQRLLSATEQEGTPPFEPPQENFSRPGRPFSPTRATRDFSHPHYWAPFILVG
ncbi:MAG TPA: CHAT domain-containing protein, partial [Prolixibacteraceae bacterium]|nr:CHAT domain-containing protein [Prolixibacteraceae bacterium]